MWACALLEHLNGSKTMVRILLVIGALSVAVVAGWMVQRYLAEQQAQMAELEASRKEIKVEVHVPPTTMMKLEAEAKIT